MSAPDLTERSIADLTRLDGRTAVVTGAARGTGAGIARRLAQAGAAVVITDADAATADDAARGLADTGLGVNGMRLDVTDETSFDLLACTVTHDVGPIDVWVNNAGIYPGGSLLEMTSPQWDEVLDHNLKGAFLGARTAARHMSDADRSGVIINIGSIASFRAPSRGLSHYVASKFGLRGLTQALASELGPHGIRVLGIAPTFTDS